MHTEHSLAEAKAIRAATSWSTSRIQHNWNQRGLSAGAGVGACYADPRLCARTAQYLRTELGVTMRIPMTLYGACSVKSFLSYCFLFQTT